MFRAIISTNLRNNKLCLQLVYNVPATLPTGSIAGTFNLMYLLTAVGLTPGGSSTVQYSTHLHTNTIQNDIKQTIHGTTQNFGRVRAVPCLCGFCPGICLTNEEKARKNLSQSNRRVPDGTRKTGCT